MASTYELYGAKWQTGQDPLEREFQCIRAGGKWITQSGKECGNGIEFHFRKAQEILWPEKVWHRWNVLELKCYLKYSRIGEVGSAASGKSHSAGSNVLLDWYVWPERTTVLISTTKLEMLEMRTWGEIKMLHKLAKMRHSWIPGHLIEGRHRIVLNPKNESVEGRDFKNGLMGLACKKGENYVGLGDYVGIHNKRVRLVCDEGQFMPRAYLDSVSNLAKCPDFKALVLGNLKDSMDALGQFCEPSAAHGGWDGGIDQTPKTKTWETRWPDGICIQLPGMDCPNMDDPIGTPPRFPFLITREQIAADEAFYGRDSLMFTMMNEARLPRGQGARRVITRQMCTKFRAMEPPVWKGGRITKIGFMDAAYRGVGGDRCVFGELQFGAEAESSEPQELINNIVTQHINAPPDRTILALIDTVLVPIKQGVTEMPEDQIADFVKHQCEARGIPPENFFFDSTGRGSLALAFGRLWSPNVVGIEFGGGPTERNVSSDIDLPCNKYYSKFVSELWYSVSHVIQSGQFRGMTEEVMNEGCMREWGFVAGHKIEVEPKEKMKLKTGRSPDLFDALAAGVEGARQRGFVIKRMVSSDYRRESQKWKRDIENRHRELVKSKQLNYT